MTAERLGTRDIKITDLSFFPGNARRGNVAKIRESVRRLGQYRTVVVRDTGDRLVILAGNHTVKAMRAEGHETVACDVIRCSDDEATRIAIADNRLSDLATDDTDALLELLSSLDDDYEATGFTEEDVTALLTPPDPGGDGEGSQDSDSEVRLHAVVLLCDSETDQKATVQELADRGYKPVPCRLGETVLRDAV